MKRRRMIQHTFLPSMPSIFVPLLGFTTDMFLVQYQHFHPYQSFFRCLVRRYIDRKRLLLASFVDKLAMFFLFQFDMTFKVFLFGAVSTLHHQSSFYHQTINHHSQYTFQTPDFPPSHTIIKSLYVHSSVNNIVVVEMIYFECSPAMHAATIARQRDQPSLRVR